MNTVVLDASAALSQLLPSQATTAIDAFFDATDWLFLAPYVFDWEVRNALLMRRSKLGDATYRQAVSTFDAMDVARGPATALEHLSTLAGLAALHRVSLFDAAYLLLSIDTEAPIASRDGVLLDAARGHDLPVHDLR